MTVIRWLGQACFLIMTLGGAHVLIDPPGPTVGYRIAAHSIPADLVFVSHQHPDHNYVAAARPTPRGPTKFIKPLAPPVPPDIGGYGDVQYSFGAPGLAADKISARQVSAFHDDAQGKERGPDTINVLETGGLRIAHLGDIGQGALTDEQLTAIGRVDVLMIPVGGFFTVDGAQAAALVAQLKPRVIIPMHYRTQVLSAALKSKLHTRDEFLSAMQGKAQVVTVKARDLKLSPKTLPKRPTIYLLPYQ